MKLVIGDKSLSSWSLRPWIVMKHFGIPFSEILVPLDQPETRSQMLKYSASGRVPVLIDGDVTVWDSLSILEYLNEKFPDRHILPEDQKERAWIRSICAEMHAGFTTLRTHLPFRLDYAPSGYEIRPALPDIERIKALWTEALKDSGGPYLFGEFTMADAMYLPVVLGRFHSYRVPVEGVVADYCRTMLALPALRGWTADAVRP